MTLDQVRSLVAYNRWATARLLDAVESLDPEERTRDLRASFTSVHGTLIHILWGESGWLQFWKRDAFLPRPTPDDYPDFASMRSAWAEHEDAYATHLHGVTQAALDAPRRLDGHTYTLGELIQHALNHSTHHRGQVTLLVRQLGHEPPSTDYHDFLREESGNRELAP